MRFVYDDGGRRAAGFAGRAGDCVARAIAIAGEYDYGYVYEALADGTESERRSRRGGATSGKRTARSGIHTSRKWFKDWMVAHGWRWVATMRIGSGCKVHLKDGELPMGRLVVSVSKHFVAVIDGVVRDTHDDQRDGTRCVYGYWVKA